MKRITSGVSYTVPHWGFCNCDANPTNDKSLKVLCRFCVKKGNSYFCVLHEEPLEKGHTLIEKTAKCNRITLGANERIEEKPMEPVPAVDPKKLIKMSIDNYEKQVTSLQRQGYPLEIARTVAREYVLGGD